MAEDGFDGGDRKRSRIAASLRASLLDRFFFVLVAIAVAAGFATWYGRGEAAFDRALHEAADFALFILPRMTAALLIAAFMQVLLPRELISKLIGEQAGLRGIVIATLAGAATPGGPLTAFPIVVALYATGANKGALIAYIAAWAMFGFQRILVWEYPLLGPDFTMVRVASSALLPIAAGLIANRLPWEIHPPGAAETDRDGEG